MKYFRTRKGGDTCCFFQIKNWTIRGWHMFFFVETKVERRPHVFDFAKSRVDP